MIAYAWATGLIGFGHKTPRQALPVVSAPETDVRRLVAESARLAHDGESQIVPGVPEAEGDNAKVDALIAYRDRLSRRLAQVRPRPVPVQWIATEWALPDADLTVLLHTPRSADPVWPGFYDGEFWYFIDGTPVHDPVAHWADFPAPPAPLEAPHAP